MDLFTLKSLLFLPFFIGCCVVEGILYAAVGRNVTLKTSHDNLDDFIIDWTFFEDIEGNDMVLILVQMSEGQLKVFQSYEDRLLVNRTNGDLTLRSLELRDSGEYNFFIETADGTRFRNYTKLQVLEPISCTKITGPTVTLIAGSSTATLSCQAAAGTMMTRTWLKDGKPLSASSHLVFSDDMSSMTINPLQKEDDGEYTCQLNNIISIDEASYKMVVNCECLFC
ncbi:carcinoembryonic antigen-related cell adhesion molecule 1-like protein [Lates japonicus]|uniref:Carcinoembryonic antigen-related cell adhesion molecule 1-like protein n=1 Tax=Lates japonicus TaxID=270547 RepID=A0AAD3R9Y7_LATJO|nr:carcinoembryonic antigen-related cell adhesion molecule 1-like protein [Lates japonicus]GLD60375.1 carcinoembryonic antigen-related cell adhesion molecule 1-like protein [Lates japonicus]